MKDFYFNTYATTKENDNGKYYISCDIIPKMVISAENLKTALAKYQEKADFHCVSISNNAIKKAAPMYIDTENGAEQTGLVITGKTAFETDGGRWIEKYIDLWVEISVLENAFENIA